MVFRKKKFIALVWAGLALPAAAQNRDEQIARMVDGMKDSLVNQRRHFHLNPELSNREERTSRVIAAIVCP